MNSPNQLIKPYWRPIIKSCILSIQLVVLLIILCTTCALSANEQTDNYLLKPTGNYGIGYQDVFLVNTDVCPDAFYHQNINEVDFSPTNKQHCHEIILRIYYPSTKVLGLGDKVYAPFYISENNWLVKQNKLSMQEAAKLNTVLNVTTYASANSDPFQDKKFPIVVFMLGSGQPIQTYNNIVSNLVSNGYIVIGVNSLFINGALKLSSGHVVKPPDSYLDVDGRKENISDLKFVLDHLTKIEYESDLAKSMDFNNVGLIGHSRGGMSIVNLLKQNPNYNNIKSIILMDPGDLLLQANYPLPKFSIPTMIIWSSYFKKEMKGSVLLGKNNYEVILNPKNAGDSFSKHENFSDKSTLQYNPGYQIDKVHKTIMVGDGNGYEITKEINGYILAFFNAYVKNIANNNLSE